MRAYEYKDTNRLVEEFMLLANCAVGEKIVEAFPSVAVLRRHPAPKEKMLKEFGEMVKKRIGKEIDFKYGTNKELGESLALVASRVKDPVLGRLVRAMVTRCMNQAVYFASGTVDVGSYYHYGLAMNVYTHFTSPIRRYADVLVHRLLAAAIGIAPLPTGYEGKGKMEEQCGVINFKHRNAQFCGRKSAELHAYLYFKHLLEDTAGASIQAIATVLGVKPREDNEVRLSVSVPKFGVEGVCMLPGDKWRVTGELAESVETNESIEVFDKIKVSISTSDEDFRFRLVFEFGGKTIEVEDSRQVEKTRKEVEKEMFPDKLQRFDEGN
jgi:exosome complex exonuclease DIS3/RRP44